MHHDNNFAEFIYNNMHYARFPEVIEFYTGIDRRRKDALKVLAKDLEYLSSKIQSTYGIPDKINPYKYIQWAPSQKMLSQMENEVREGISASNLPAAIKDQYTDRLYDKRNPYYQEIREIFSDKVLLSLMFSLTAASRALRNSDYVDPDVKRTLLTQILNGWKELTKVLLITGPILAIQGHASIDGIRFLLEDGFGETPEERLRRILICLPGNVVAWFRDDLSSHKMGPLLVEKFSAEKDDIKKHELALLLVNQRPRKWKEVVKKYIGDIAKNSFYLYDVMMMLRHQYSYSYATPNELKDIEYLIKMSATKHRHGIKKPSNKAIKKVQDTVLPDRKVD